MYVIYIIINYILFNVYVIFYIFLYYIFYIIYIIYCILYIIYCILYIVYYILYIIYYILYMITVYYTCCICFYWQLHLHIVSVSSLYNMLQVVRASSGILRIHRIASSLTQRLCLHGSANSPT